MIQIQFCTNTTKHLLRKYAYIIFSNRGKLAGSNSETAPTLHKTNKPKQLSQGKKNQTKTTILPKDMYHDLLNK